MGYIETGNSVASTVTYLVIFCLFFLICLLCLFIFCMFEGGSSGKKGLTRTAPKRCKRRGEKEPPFGNFKSLKNKDKRRGRKKRGNKETD